VIPLSKAVLDLLVPMLTPLSSELEHPLMRTIELTCQKSETQVGYVGGNAATLLGRICKLKKDTKCRVRPK